MAFGRLDYAAFILTKLTQLYLNQVIATNQMHSVCLTDRLESTIRQITWFSLCWFLRARVNGILYHIFKY